MTHTHLPGRAVDSYTSGTRLALTAVLSAVLATTLSACGGGSRSEPFKATRMVAFGDEYSYLPASATAAPRYIVNYLPDNTNTSSYNCRVYPLWVQSVADYYNLDFAGCPRSGGAAVTALMEALPGQNVAAVIGQIDGFVASKGGFRKGDVVTLLAGSKDVLDAYAQYPATPLATLRASIRALGEQLGRKTQTITDGGARLLLATLPDLGLTPYAIAQAAANGGASVTSATSTVDCNNFPSEENRQIVLSVLTACFNEGMRSKIENDGNKIGLVVTEQLIREVVRNPASYGAVDDTGVRTGICAVSLPGCALKVNLNGTPSDGSDDTFDYSDLATNELAKVQGWLWAGETYLGPNGHIRLGSLAISRADTNWE